MMRPMQLGELEQVLQGTLHGGDAGFDRVFTDSRDMAPGGLFVALDGERFDGHDYVADVARAGAAGALVSRAIDVELPQLRVADTEIALGRLGAFNRSLYAGPLVAITGSSGKTTVKNLISSVLSQRGQTLATQGNLNNEIGVPLTLLRLSQQCEFAVVEMGAGKPGDIAWLCELARPGISVLLNVMPAHLERMGSLQGIADTKGAIFDGLGAGDVAVMSADEPWAESWRSRAGAARIIDFSLRGDAVVTAADIVSRGILGSDFTARTPLGETRVALRFPGAHNVANALAAIAVGIACELSLAEITAGLEAAEPAAGRLALVKSEQGALLIDDCYNANPGSVRAAIDTLAASEGRCTLVLGAMRELGEGSGAMHDEIGNYARDAGLDAFWGVGEELRVAVANFGENGLWFADCDSALHAARGVFTSADIVLVKGSRGARMERFLNGMRADSTEGES
ncbi:UDP-N-acetylmuramoyl-tripeptide--D-alanyl-D-alanine ligase [Pseudohalioglobus sediminis]|uniref:UDP-N-acetylmuramoyl-tripeptide--D-alanyl-D-alanine ligase n=1 Tax=Pseudohalioglobus sediminis TaxID=2606449 RepID=A0A5B0X767_9GAMM|nr:UDP-N-acetylmuramoyl-tripeptide--D-alanyl-D-alanine ligase [Pseudohalioglobus sediminis]KAA1194495.1 UDP-N-acetylmuramoyl-tripeptide--D-alanyl-D-alanine ligase [Pseudohalioglobus sediminis]